MQPTYAESPAVPPASRQLPRSIYQQRLAAVSSTCELLKQAERRFVRIRVALFLVAVCLGIICIGDDRVPFWSLSIPALLFVGLLPLHARCLRQLNRFQTIRKFHEECLQRMDDQWTARPRCGSRFQQSVHDWSADLDIFGAGSLFQLISECRTGPGQERLASWMSTVPTLEEIQLRQVRSEALKNELSLRESLAAVPDDVDWQKASRLLNEWVHAPSVRIPAWIRGGTLIVGLCAIPTVVAVALGLLPNSSLLLLMILQGPFILLTRQQIRRVFLSMDSVDRALQQLSDVLVILESQTFQDPALSELQAQFSTSGEAASRSIQRLSSLTRWLNHSLRNQFFAPIAWMGGLLVQLTDRLEHWRQQYRMDVGRWLSTVAEFESLLSIAAYRFEHPDYTSPLVSDSYKTFHATQLGHPLLAAANCVRNDVSLTTAVPLMLISGSNMSGKSTLLRAVGTNLVLTYCGSVVNAERLETYPFQLSTAMRISDSLQEGRSLFYSVVQRLKSVVDLTHQPRTVLFLLDEILHGTNSHDRRRGAEGIIRSLVRQGAMGIVTTHDLALTQIVDSMDGQGINMHFEDVVADGRMTFDYQLRAGVVQRSNALELMRMMGLDV